MSRPAIYHEVMTVLLECDEYLTLLDDCGQIGHLGGSIQDRIRALIRKLRDESQT